MNKNIDEAEHSLEMHIPYIKKVFNDYQFKLVPIMVGNLSPKAEQEYGQKLAPYLADDENLFIISSDFCHWGSNFDYYYYKNGANNEKVEIWKSVENLDKLGMNYIESHDFQGFTKYLDETDNTICGRHPIGVFMNAL